MLGDDAERIEAAIDWGGARRVVNREPERGLSSSLQVGFDAIGSDSGQVLVVLGDQPLVSAAVIRSLIDAPEKRGRSIVVPVYPEDRGRNRSWSAARLQPGLGGDG